MKNLVLINPPFNSYSTYKFNFNKVRCPHVGLAYLAGYLNKHEIEFEVIDAKFFNLDEKEVIGRLVKLNPKIIGLTSTTTEIKDVIAFSTNIKRHLPGSFVILGGVHATALPDETIRENASLDAVAVGEGEFILKKLSKANSISETVERIPGLYYRKNGIIKNTSEQIYGNNLHDYAPASFSLWPRAKKYFINTYRGCPFRCSFCFRTLGRKARYRDIEHILVDLEYVLGHEPNSDLSICDSTFGLNREYTENMLSKIIENGLSKRLKWDCTTRVDIVDKEFLALIKKAGCHTISFGIESGSDRVLKATGKNTSVQKCVDAVNLAKSLGFKTWGYYILGHIDETKSEIEKTVRLIYKLNTDGISVGIMTPWPGTDVYKLALENKGGYRLQSKDYSKYDKYFGSVLEFQNFNLTYLDFMRIRTFFGLYIHNSRYAELLGFLYRNKSQVINKVVQLIKRCFREMMRYFIKQDGKT